MVGIEENENIHCACVTQSRGLIVYPRVHRPIHIRVKLQQSISRYQRGGYMCSWNLINREYTDIIEWLE